MGLSEEESPWREGLNIRLLTRVSSLAADRASVHEMIAKYPSSHNSLELLALVKKEGRHSAARVKEGKHTAHDDDAAKSKQ